MKSIFKSNFISLGILLGLSLVIVTITSHYILTVKFFDDSEAYFSGIPGQEANVYASLQKYIYLTTVAYILVKLLITALVLYTALYLADKFIPFGKALHIAILSEFIFLLQAVLKIAWFNYRYPHGTLMDWHSVYVLSALSITGDVSADWYYPLQTLNVFEIAYWFLLALGIRKATSLNYDQSLRLILASYVPLLFIWVVTVTFCTVMVFPGKA